MADGTFLINDRRSLREAPQGPAARSFGLSHYPVPTRCTPDDPFGRGYQGAAWREPSPWSKTEAEQRLAHDKSAAELGDAFLGPTLKAAEWSPPGRALRLILELRDIGESLAKSGSSGLAGKSLGDLAIKEAGKLIEERFRLLKGTGDLMGKALGDAIKLGTGGAPIADSPPPPRSNPPAPPTAKPDPPKDDYDSPDGPRWYSPRRERGEQNQIQQGVDRHDKRKREDPGTMIA